MACVRKMHKVNAESEMEEGEIIDDLDDLSDISSEEEFLLRQRLEVLENYNNVLERKKAKRSSMGPGTKSKREILCDLSEVSATELEDSHYHDTHKHIKRQPYVPQTKQKRRKEPPFADENNVRRKKENQKKKNMRKKKLSVKVVSESSDESEDEYRNKRKKLADAVIVHKGADKSSLSARLHKMIHWSEAHIHPVAFNKSTEPIVPGNHINVIEALSPISSVNADEDDPTNVNVTDKVLKHKSKTILESIEVSTDDDEKIITDDSLGKDKVEELEMVEDVKECELHVEKDDSSDDDLELLRQDALKSKALKPKSPEPSKTEQKPLSEDEDSDTAELRLICLKSALLKKAIEMKQKQKWQKKLSQSSNIEGDLLSDNDLFTMKDGNNTDIESVDMDMGSDADDKLKDCNAEHEKKNSRLFDNNENNDFVNCAINNINSDAKEDELDDDEDLLRARLLTSLSKNLPNLVNPEEVLKTIDQGKGEKSPQPAAETPKAPEAKKFIIKLDESDSEGEHEATENLTKMHIKLSEQKDFQLKLDQFLKSARTEVEKSKLPDVLQKPLLPKKPNKFVAKAVTNLPKSEQLEYRNLVRRMAELEKMKQIRQATLNLLKQQQHAKDTLKPRNVTIDTSIKDNLEDLIAKSRKTIAEESSKMLRLKEEATKLSQRYKIAATELRNISTAITLNKKQQRAVQVSLSKIRLQHQSLLQSSTTSLHSKINGHIPHLSNLSNKALSNKLLKENNPKDEYKNVLIQKAVKISVVNDFVAKPAINNKISVQLDVANTKKVAKIPYSEADVGLSNDSNHDIENEDQKLEEQKKRLFENNNDENTSEAKEEVLLKDSELVAVYDHGNKRYYISVDDYESPLGALGSTTWQADPNAILCPFEVGGHCKDNDCKYLHTPNPAQ